MAEEKETKTKDTDVSGKEQKEVEIPAQFKDLVASIAKMTVMDLAEFVKVLEEKFGVSSAAPVVVAGGAAQGAGEEGDEASSIVNVELTEGGSSMISVIKALRVINNELGLKEAKDLVDSAPVVVKEGVGREEAEEIKKNLEEAGAKVTLK